MRALVSAGGLVVPGASASIASTTASTATPRLAAAVSSVAPPPQHYSILKRRTPAVDPGRPTAMSRTVRRAKGARVVVVMLVSFALSLGAQPPPDFAPPQSARPVGGVDRV